MLVNDEYMNLPGMKAISFKEVYFFHQFNTFTTWLVDNIINKIPNATPNTGVPNL